MHHPSVDWKFGAWFAGASGQTIKTRLGHRHDRSLYLTAVRAERVLGSFRWGTVLYTADFQPLIVATANREYTVVSLCTPGLPCQFPDDAQETIPTRHTAYGAGIVPAGIRVEIGIWGPLGLALGASGGGAYFDRRIPDPGETRFNFTADGNAAMALRTHLGAMSVGIRQHHISNGYTGRVNPAIDSRLMFVEYTW